MGFIPSSRSAEQEWKVERGIQREKPTPNQKKSPGKPQRNILENHKELTLKTKCSSGVLHQSLVGVTCSTWENSFFSEASCKVFV